MTSLARQHMAETAARMAEAWQEPEVLPHTALDDFLLVLLLEGAGVAAVLLLAAWREGVLA